MRILDDHQVRGCDGRTDKTPFGSIRQCGLYKGKGVIAFWVGDSLDCSRLNIKLSGHFHGFVGPKKSTYTNKLIITGTLKIRIRIRGRKKIGLKTNTYYKNNYLFGLQCNLKKKLINL